MAFYLYLTLPLHLFQTLFGKVSWYNLLLMNAHFDMFACIGNIMNSMCHQNLNLNIRCGSHRTTNQFEWNEIADEERNEKKKHHILQLQSLIVDRQHRAYSKTIWFFFFAFWIQKKCWSWYFHVFGHNE